MVLYDDAQLPHSIPQMLPVVLREFRTQFPERHEPSLCLGLMVDVQCSSIVAGLAAAGGIPVETDSKFHPNQSIAYTLYSSRA